MCIKQTATAVETYKVMALSTAHLTEDDIRILTEEANDSDEWMVMQREPGFFIKLYADESDLNYTHGHSQTLKQIIRYAVSHGYEMIEFDRDAAIVSMFLAGAQKIELTEQQRGRLIDAITDDFVKTLSSSFRGHTEWTKDVIVNGRVPLTDYSDDALVMAAQDAELDIGALLSEPKE